MSDSEDLKDPLSGEDDLFGDGEGSGDEAPISDPEQLLSDLDDEGEDTRRYGDSGEADGAAPTIRVQAVKMFRHQTPKPSDGTVRLRLSALLGIEMSNQTACS